VLKGKRASIFEDRESSASGEGKKHSKLIELSKIPSKLNFEY
jgi:hypothetical protein